MSSEMQELIKAMREQTSAINQLVQVTSVLIQSMALDEEDPDAPQTFYLDGSPLDRAR